MCVVDVRLEMSIWSAHAECPTIDILVWCSWTRPAHATSRTRTKSISLSLCSLALIPTAVSTPLKRKTHANYVCLQVLYLPGHEMCAVFQKALALGEQNPKKAPKSDMSKISDEFFFPPANLKSFMLSSSCVYPWMEMEQPIAVLLWQARKNSLLHFSLLHAPPGLSLFPGRLRRSSTRQQSNRFDRPAPTRTLRGCRVPLPLHRWRTKKLSGRREHACSPTSQLASVRSTRFGGRLKYC